MRFAYCCILFLFFTQILNGQGKTYIQQMERIIAHEDTASTPKSILGAATAFAGVAGVYPQEWIPSYWASYTFSQASQSSSEMRDRLAYADSADSYYDRAWKVFDKQSKNDESEFYALKSLLHGLRSAYARTLKDVPTSAKQLQMRDEFLQKAIKANPENPRVYMLLGTTMIGKAMNADSNKVENTIIGKALLEISQQKFKVFQPTNSVGPRWGNWAGFWLTRQVEPLLSRLKSQG